jgi:hypothetical protein
MLSMKFKLMIGYIIIVLSIQNNNLVAAPIKIEQWKIFELTLYGPEAGNPFTDVELSADFKHTGQIISIAGFYDGEGKYKVRFMPQFEGEWTYETKSNIKKLNGKKGKFVCTPPSQGNHGLVSVKDTFYFAYADGTPHHSFGTTCYAWVHQGDSLAELTLKTLSNGYFNKIRMCLFPKDYRYNRNEPENYPYEGKPLTEWDYTRFNPAYFRNIEKRIGQLDSLGIEADLIIFHPYDRWGFENMDSVTNERYIRYVIARFSAYKNVWWSMANEYNLIKSKTITDWQRYLQLFAENDPYNHIRSVHNSGTVFTESSLISHLSVQNRETAKAYEYRTTIKKPVIYDECKYEGNIERPWGSLTARELVHRFWVGMINGGYVGHGETLLTDDLEQSAVLWWSKGGTLKGESPDRIKFLREIIESAPAYLKPVKSGSRNMWNINRLSYNDEYFLEYIPYEIQPILHYLDLPEGKNYEVEVIDTWNMTIEKLPKLYSGSKNKIPMPGKPGMAIRMVLRK